MTQPFVATTFDVSNQVPPLTGELHLAAWIFAPDAAPTGTLPVVICLPGGSYTKAYYHLEVPGYPVNAYSFALHLARAGFLVIALDHLGVGESTRPADGHQLLLDVAAHANAIAVQQVRTRLAEGTLLEGLAPQQQIKLIGVGHSMGAFLLLAQQANHHSFDLVAPLGYSNRELATGGIEKAWAEDLGFDLNDEETIYEFFNKMNQVSIDGYARINRKIARPLFHAPDVPQAVIDADDAAATDAPAGITTDLANSQLVREHAAAIDVPLFLGNADIDVSADFHGEPATYPQARDITLFQLAGSAHCHNFATTRTILWDRLVHWIAASI